MHEAPQSNPASPLTTEASTDMAETTSIVEALLEDTEILPEEILLGQDFSAVQD